MTTKDKIIEALREVYDPEIPINIVDLGLIYDIQIHPERITVQMTLTTPHCPLAGMLQIQVKNVLHKLDRVRRADVELVWDPPWTPDRLSPDLKAEFEM